MKKICSLFLLLLTLVITSCSCNNSKVYLTSEFYNSEVNEDSVFIDLKNEQELENLTNSDSTYVLYIHSSTCGGCIAFTPVFKAFLTEKGIISYRVEISISKSSQSLVKDIKSTPTVLVISNGEIIAKSDPNSDDDTYLYKSKEGFEKWISKYIYLESEK